MWARYDLRLGNLPRTRTVLDIVDANLQQLLEKLLADTPLTAADYRLLLGLPPVKPVTCMLVSDEHGRKPCCSS